MRWFASSRSGIAVAAVLPISLRAPNADLQPA
jgi:hypothetical protein